MNTKNLFLTGCILFTASSCASCYYVHTDVGRDGGLDRTFYFHRDPESVAKADRNGAGNLRALPADSVFTIDFFGEKEEMNMAADSISGNLYHPEESLRKRFRWFYTYYDYKAVFPSLKEKLAIPLDSCMTRDEQELFLRGGRTPEGWNGIELYGTLDELNTAFFDWAGECLFKIHFETLCEYVSAEGKAALTAARDSLARLFRPEELIRMNMDDFALRADAYVRKAGSAPGLSFSGTYSRNREAIDLELEEKTAVQDYFSQTYLHRVTLPGKYFKGNPGRLEAGDPVWKIDAYRLLSDDLVTEATSRVPHPWAFLLTGLAALLCLVAALRLR